MLYNPAAESVEDVLANAAGLLLDIGGTVSNTKTLTRWYKMAWSEMVLALKSHSVNELEKTVSIVVPSGAASFGPSFSGAEYKSALLDDMAKFEPPLYININGFLQELKVAENPADFNIANRFVYRVTGGVFYITRLVTDTTFQLQYYSNLACPLAGSIGINDAFLFLVFRTAELSGLADGNIGANLSDYKDRASYFLNQMVSNLVQEEGPITPGLQDQNENDGTRRFVLRPV